MAKGLQGIERSALKPGRGLLICVHLTSRHRHEEHCAAAPWERATPAGVKGRAALPAPSARGEPFVVLVLAVARGGAALARGGQHVLQVRGQGGAGDVLGHQQQQAQALGVDLEGHGVGLRGRGRVEGKGEGGSRCRAATDEWRKGAQGVGTLPIGRPHALHTCANRQGCACQHASARQWLPYNHPLQGSRQLHPTPPGCARRAAPAARPQRPAARRSCRGAARRRAPGPAARLEGGRRRGGTQRSPGDGQITRVWIHARTL